MFDKIVQNYLNTEVKASFENDEDETADDSQAGAEDGGEHVYEDVEPNVLDTDVNDIEETAIQLDEDDLDAPGITLPEAKSNLNEAKRDLDGIVEELETKEDAVASLESLYTIMSNSLVTGGLSPFDAALATRVIDTLPIRNRNGVIPSCESFGGVTSQLEATQVSMEGVMDAIRELKNNISNRISEYMVRVKNWWLRITDFNLKLNKRAQRVKQSLDELTGSPYAKLIHLESYILAIGKKSVTPSELISGLEYNLKLTQDLLDEATLSKVNDEFIRIAKLAALSTDIDSYIANMPDATKVFKCLTTKLPKETINNAAYDALGTKDLIGNYIIVAPTANGKRGMELFAGQNEDLKWIYLGETANRTIKHVETIDAQGRVISTDSYTVNHEDTNYETLNKAQMERVITLVTQMSELNTKFRMAWQKRSESYNKIFNDIASTISETIGDVALQNEVTADQRYGVESSSTKTFNKLAKWYWKDWYNFTGEWISYNHSVNSDALDYCITSMDNFK